MCKPRPKRHLERRRKICSLLLLGWIAWSASAQAALFQGVFSDPLDTGRWVTPAVGKPWTYRPRRLPQAPATPSVYFVHPMGLPALTAFALAHNPASRVAFANLQAAAAGLGVAESGYLPTLTLQSGAIRSEANTTAGFSIPIQNTDSTSLSLSYVLLDFGARAAQRDGALAEIYINGFDNNIALQGVALSVTQNYYLLLGEQALVRAYRRTVAEDVASLDAAKIKQRSGLATVADVLQAQAALAQARANLISAEAQVRSDDGALAQSCGLPSDDIIPVVSLDTRVLPPLVTPALRALVYRARMDNPAIQSTAAQILADRATVRADQAAGMPTLNFGVSGGKRFQNGLFPAENWSVGFTLRVPLFTGFKDTYQIQEARANERSARASLREETQKIESTVFQDYQQILGARSAAGAARLAVISARASLKAIQAQYRVGLTTMLNVLTAEATLTTAEQTEIQDITTSYTQLANLANALGYIGFAKTLNPRQESR
jgi:outer membrane protein TolC